LVFATKVGVAPDDVRKPTTLLSTGRRQRWKDVLRSDPVEELVGPNASEFGLSKSWQ
jgi:hypothetical protein